MAASKCEKTPRRHRITEPFLKNPRRFRELMMSPECKLSMFNKRDLNRIMVACFESPFEPPKSAGLIGQSAASTVMLQRESSVSSSSVPTV